VFTVFGPAHDAIGRRSFLRAGVLGLGGLTIADAFRLQAHAKPQAAPKSSVILFWLSGGPGPMETWDPKPDALADYRGPLRTIRSAVPGIQLGELLPHQARVMDRLAILRTVSHGSEDHTTANHWMLTGVPGPAFNAPDKKVQRRPALGAAVSRLRGPNVPGMPPYVAVPHLLGETANFFHNAAYLGGGANPFVTQADPNGSDFRVKNLALPSGLPFERLQDRRGLLAAVDQVRRSETGRMADRDAHYQRAFDMLTSQRVAAAFDLSAEPAAVRDRFGRHTFGQSALLARRLVEAGVTFVTVNCIPWDHHGVAESMKTAEGARKLIPPLDRAIASLIDDLVQRSLYDQTLVVAMGEFGRTPKMNANAGRDHWGHTFGALFGCGSMRMGQAIGRSSPRGEWVADRPVRPEDVAATIYHHLGIDARSITFADGLNRPHALLESGEPIRELIG
jgi:hypothetical protein